MSKRLHALILFALIAGFAVMAGCTGTGGPGSITPLPSPAKDLTNRNSSEAATFTAYPSLTKLQAPAVPVGLRFVAGGFISPMNIAVPHDGTGRLFLSDQNGFVNIFFMNGTVIDKPFLDIRDRMVKLDPAYDERGLLSIAFHPDYTTNGRVFVYYSAPKRAGVDPNWSATNRLSEFHVLASDPNQADMSSEKILLEVDKPYQNHNGGVLLFGPDDGYLYLPLGDSGRADDTGMGHTVGTGNGQDLTKILGKVIRIDVDHTSPGKQYGIPADNPFVANTSIQPEIYAYGFRNPAYATFDSGGSHRMFIAMAGQRLFESVLIVYKGGDYPWNIREGTHCFNPANDFLPGDPSCPITGSTGQPLIGPVVELGHDVGDTVVGGVLYRGNLIPSLQGKYVYGTWSDENRIVGNGTLLVSTPPAGLDLSALPGDASALTPAQNAMWTTREVSVSNNANGRINAFVRALYENDDHEILVLINRNGGPGLTPQGSGEIWQMVPAGTPGLASTTAKITPTAGAAPVSGEGTPVTVQLAIAGDKFNPPSLTVPAGAPVTLVYNDQDPDPHNFAIYPSLSASTAIFRGPVITGPVTQVYTFTAPSVPGTYYFRSDPNAGLQGILNVTSGSMPLTIAPAPAPAGPVVPITLTAENLTFDVKTLTAPAGSTVVMTFVNKDNAMPHNFALYTDSTAATKIFAGDFITGPGTVTYTFAVPSKPGNYFFRCDIHPELMTGTFIVT
ncbi:MAG: PQQ-dependent sugar dehydrogenase [Methanoregula sp.]